MSISQHRQVVQEETFKKAFEALQISYNRLDDVLLGCTLALCVRPEKCPVIPGTILSMLKTRPFPNIPPLRIFFTYTDEQVHLRHVEIVTGSSEPSEVEDGGED